jgi:alpha/beta hydrolase fold
VIARIACYLQVCCSLVLPAGRQPMQWSFRYAVRSRTSALWVLIVWVAIFQCDVSQTRSKGCVIPASHSDNRVEDLFYLQTIRKRRNQGRCVSFSRAGFSTCHSPDHGGALIFGSRSMLPADKLGQFLQAGFVVVAIDHRLAPETKLPEILKDVNGAIDWVRTKGPSQFRADPRHVAVVGQSAGAYLAIMEGIRARTRVQRVFRSMAMEISLATGIAIPMPSF